MYTNNIHFYYPQTKLEQDEEFSHLIYWHHSTGNSHIYWFFIEIAIYDSSRNTRAWHWDVHLCGFCCVIFFRVTKSTKNVDQIYFLKYILLNYFNNRSHQLAMPWKPCILSLTFAAWFIIWPLSFVVMSFLTSPGDWPMELVSYRTLKDYSLIKCVTWFGVENNDVGFVLVCFTLDHWNTIFTSYTFWIVWLLQQITLTYSRSYYLRMMGKHN